MSIIIKRILSKARLCSDVLLLPLLYLDCVMTMIRWKCTLHTRHKHIGLFNVRILTFLAIQESQYSYNGSTEINYVQKSKYFEKLLAKRLLATIFSLSTTFYTYNIISHCAFVRVALLYAL